MKPDWETPDGSIQLYCADCLDVLPGLGAVDALVTDPPYGIGEASGKNKSRGTLATAVDYGVSSWDDDIRQAEIELAQSITRDHVIFGGNYYRLPPTSCWLVWDKMNGANDFADCELAWTNLTRAVRMIRHRWNGMIREGNEARFHPTQKPLAVMQWAVGFTSGGVLDPFMGSGTTGVACVSLGRKFIGIEKEPKYFAIAVKRIEDALGKGTLFDGIEEMKQKYLFD